MSVYSDLKSSKKANNSKNAKSFVRNQRIFNVFNLVLCLTMILADILYLIKGNILGINSFTNSFMIVSLVLEVLMLIVLGLIRFNSENKILKAIAIVIYTLPIIAYIGMFSLDGYSILLFILRILLAIVLAIEIIKGGSFRTGKAFLVKGIIAGALVLIMLIPSIILIASNRPRNAIYSKNSDGYVLEDVLSGSAPVEIKDGTTKIGSTSLKNAGNSVTFPSTVKNVDKDAFNESSVEELHISSKEINMVDALNNSNITKVYLEAVDIKINDIENLDTTKNIKFIALKSDVDKYRETYSNYQSLFIPKTDENEYYVILNNTTSKILYYKAGELFTEPTDVKINSEYEMKLLSWYYTNDNSKSPTFPITVNDNIEISARWARVYTFTFDYNGGTIVEATPGFENSPTVLKWALAEGNIVFPTLEKENYRFDGWYDDNGNLSTGVYINMYVSSSFTAKFSKIYKVDYHLNGGYFEDEYEAEFVEGEPNEPKIPVRTGYTFMGWYDNENLSGDAVKYVYYEGTSLYAKWELNNPTITLCEDINKTYDGEAVELKATISHELDGNKSFTYSIAWYKKDSSSPLSNTLLIDAEEASYYCVVTLNHMGNTKKVQSDYVKVNIQKADYDLTDIVFNDETFTYEFNGEEQYPSITNILPTGYDDIQLTVSYTKSGDATNPDDYGTVVANFSTESKNYNVPESMTAYVSIERKELTINWDSFTHVYNGNSWNPNGTLVGVIDGYPVNLSVPSKTSIDVGSYEIKNISIDNGTYYVLSNSNTSVKYEITKADYDLSTLTYDTTTFEYDGTYHIPTITNLPETLELSSSVTGLKDVGADQASVLSFVNNSTNYNDPADVEVLITITAKTITATITETSFTYNGSIQKPTTVTFTGLVDGETTTYTVANETINAGSYTALVTIDNTNYVLDTENSSLDYTINKADYDLSGLEYESTTFEYDGSYHIPTITNLPETLKLSSSVTGLKSVGTNQALTLSFDNSSTNYNNPADVEVLITITAKTITAVITETEFTYNGSTQKPTTVTFTGFVESESTTYTVNNNSINAGSYTADITINNTNYVLDTENSTLAYTINKADYDLSNLIFTTTTFDYDGTYHVPTPTNLPSTLELASSIKGLKDAGSNQVLELTFVNSDTTNYNNPDALEVLININAKSITATITETSFTYNGSIQKPTTVTFTGLIGTETTTYTINNESIDADGYKADITVNNTNYVLDTTNSTLTYTIDKATYDLSGLEYETTTFEYDGTYHIPTPTNLPDTLEISSNVKGLKNVCSNQTLTLSFVNNSTNYNNPSSVEALITITAKSITGVISETSFTYNGSIQKPTTVTFTGFVEDESTTYTINNDSVEAGSYTADITINNTNYVLDTTNSTLTYTINKASYDLNNLSYNSTTFEYDGTYHIPTITNLPSTLEIASSVIGLKDVCSDTSLTISFVNNDTTNYNNPADVTVNVTITAKSITAVINEDTFTYNGSTQKPTTVTFTGLVGTDTTTYTINNTSVDAGDYEADITINNTNYVLDTTNSILAYTIDKATYDLSGLEYEATTFEYDGTYHIPTPTNLPSTLAISSSVVGLMDVCSSEALTLSFDNSSTNYNDPADVIVNVTITAKSITAVITETEFTYNAETQAPTTVTFTGLIGTDTTTYSINNTSVNAGSYTADITIDNSNYVLDTENSTLAYTINKADFDYQYTVESTTTVTYNQASQKPSVSTVKKYTSDKSLITYTFSETPINAGEYDITITFTASDNYNDQTLTVKLVIEKQEVTLEFDSLTTTYTGELFTPTVTAYNGLIDGDDFTVTVANSNTVEVGQYAVSFTYSGADKDNYYVDESDYKIIIYATSIIISGYTVVSYNGEYDGEYHTVLVTGLPEGVTAVFDKSYKDVCINAEVNITFTSSDPNVGISTTDVGYVTITQKEVTVEFDTTTLTYNGEVQAPIATVTGYIEGDSVNVTFDAESINVGTYSNIAFSLDNSNYKLSDSATTSLSYEIVACHVTLVWGSTTFTYNKNAQKPTATVKYNDETVDTTVNVTTDTNNINVGIYTATASLTDTNYVIDGDTETTYYIVAKKVSLEWSDTELYYNGDDQKPTATIEVISGDNCTVTVTVNSDDYNLPNTTYRAVAAISNSNYEINGNNYLDYQINKGILSISSSEVAASTTYTYDGTSKMPEIEGNKYASDTTAILYKLDSTYVDAGEYTVTVIFYTANGYYEEYDVSTTLIINKYELGIELSATELEYTGSIVVPTITITDQITGDDVAVAITNASKASSVNVGSYTPAFNITGDDATNYEIITTYTYSIIKGTIDMTSVEFSNTTVTYNGNVQLPTLSSVPYDGISIDTTNSIGVTKTTDTTATIYFTLSDTLAKNWNVPSSMEVTMTVNTCELTITWNETSFGYDGSVHLPTYTLNGVISGDSVALVLSDSGNTNRGDYSVTATGVDNANYSLSSEATTTCDYSITYGTYDMSNVVVEAKSYEYDGNSHKSIEVASGLPDGVTVSQYTYSADPINAGTYTVTISFIGDSANYYAIDDMVMTDILTITQKTITLYWSNTEFDYDKESHIPTASIYSGLIYGDECELEVSGAQINAGTYTATAASLNDNYTISSSTASESFTIDKKSIEIVVTCGTKSTTISTSGWNAISFSFNYDGKIHNDITVSYDQSDLVGTDALTISADTSSFDEWVDNYSFALTFSNSNYTARVTSGTVNITTTNVSLNNINWVRDSIYDLPEAYYTINGSSVLLSELGDGTNVYYNYYDSSINLLDAAPTESGSYYAQIYSECSSLAIPEGNRYWGWKSFTYVAISSATKNVIALIEALPQPEDVTLDDSDEINAAKEAYDALSTAEQANVSNVDKLTSCISALNALSTITIDFTDGSVTTGTNVTLYDDNDILIVADKIASVDERGIKFNSNHGITITNNSSSTLVFVLTVIGNGDNKSFTCDGDTTTFGTTSRTMTITIEAGSSKDVITSTGGAFISSIEITAA